MTAEELLALLTRKVKRLAKEAPPEFIQQEGAFLVRTVWRDFVINAKQSIHNRDGYAYKIVIVECHDIVDRKKCHDIVDSKVL
jgi:hypothetical protein